jgi:hypothetical protein
MVQEKDVCGQTDQIGKCQHRFVVKNRLWIKVLHQHADFWPHAMLRLEHNFFYIVVEQSFEQRNVQFVFHG